METLRSAIDATSEEFAANEAAQRALVVELNERLGTAAVGDEVNIEIDVLARYLFRMNQLKS